MKPILRRKVYSISMEPLLLLHNACVNFGLIDVILHADTVPPTAVVDGGAAFTHALNATVNITFSETCDHRKPIATQSKPVSNQIPWLHVSL